MGSLRDVGALERNLIMKVNCDDGDNDHCDKEDDYCDDIQDDFDDFDDNNNSQIYVSVSCFMQNKTFMQKLKKGEHLYPVIGIPEMLTQNVPWNRSQCLRNQDKKDKSDKSYMLLI